MRKQRHPNADIEDAVRYAEERGWMVTMSKGHAWATLWCPASSREGEHISVWSTPRNPTNHARQIRRCVDKCTH